MSFDREDLQSTVTVPTTPDDVLLSVLSEMFIDLHQNGIYETETSGLYLKALAVTYEDSIMSFGKFTGEGTILDGQ